MPQFTLLHFDRLNETNFLIYMTHALMNYNRRSYPISIDRTQYESFTGVDLEFPVDGILFLLQFKTSILNGRYFLISQKQLNALRVTSLSQKWTFFVLSKYRTLTELTSQMSNILNEKMFLSPLSKKFDGGGKKFRYVNYNKIFPDPKEDFVNQPHSFKELLRKSKIEKVGIPLKAKEKFSLSKFIHREVEKSGIFFEDRKNGKNIEEKYSIKDFFSKTSALIFVGENSERIRNESL